MNVTSCSSYLTQSNCWENKRSHYQVIHYGATESERGLEAQPPHRSV